jgi:hypothetical protein
MDRTWKFFILCNPIFILKPERAARHEEYRCWLSSKTDAEFNQLYRWAMPPYMRDPYFNFESETADDPQQFN